jgi:hypothetical protein
MLRLRGAAGLRLRLRTLRTPILPASAATPASPASAASALAPRLGRVDPPLLEMTERHDDLGPSCPALQEVDDLAPDRGRRVPRERRDPLGVEKHHARPRDADALAGGALELHNEEVPLVIEGVLAVLEIRKRLAAEVFEQREVFFASLQRLLHRDHPVPEHSSLCHQKIPAVLRLIRSPARRP